MKRTKKVRPSAKAIIIRDGKLLVLEKRMDGHTWYSLPGGGQDHGEALTESLKRECFEEIGCKVRVGDLLCVRDYIGRNHEFRIEDGHKHQLELYFRCDLVGRARPVVGKEPDTHQIGVIWLDLKAIGRAEFYPKSLRPFLQKGVRAPKSRWRVYLGDVN